jgi:hypothetical protein
LAGIHWFQWLSLSFFSFSFLTFPLTLPLFQSIEIVVVSILSSLEAFCRRFSLIFYLFVNKCHTSERVRERENLLCFLTICAFLLPLSRTLFSSLYLHAMYVYNKERRHTNLWVKLPIRYSFALCVRFDWNLSKIVAGR